LVIFGIHGELDGYSFPEVGNLSRNADLMQGDRNGTEETVAVTLCADQSKPVSCSDILQVAIVAASCCAVDHVRRGKSSMLGCPLFVCVKIKFNKSLL